MVRRPSLRTLLAAVLVAVGVAAVPASTAGSTDTRTDGISAFFFGDSLMGGTGAVPRRPVMARMVAQQLGWDVTVDAWGGTGYTTSGHRPSYVTRLTRAPLLKARQYDVVLLEGGTNDRPSVDDPVRLARAVHEAVDVIRARQPRARIIVMGAYNPPGDDDPRRHRIDAVIQGVAAERGLSFFSPLQGDWVDGQPKRFLHPDRLHPSTWGYGVMGTRLVAELRRLQVVPAGLEPATSAL